MLPFFSAKNQHTAIQSRTGHHRHHKIHQTGHIPHTRIKTAPPRHVLSVTITKTLNPAIFCLGMLSGNKERTTRYRSVNPVTGNAPDQPLHGYCTNCMKYRRDIHLLPLKPLPERALWCNHPLTEHGFIKAIVKKTNINKVPFVSRVFRLPVSRNT